jgi:SAM-dependent methyltransferase
MTEFSAEWLALREPVDATARDRFMAKGLSKLLRPCATLSCFDLGCGTGANVRYLSPLIAGPQQWVFLDSDAQHLERARESAATWSRDLRVACSFETRCVDLARDLDAVTFEEGALVTASALLDLVSDDWLMRLLQRCATCKAIVLFALSYDGRIELNPRDPYDEAICTLVNRHQRTDKGFGPALGPSAVICARARLEDLQYQMQSSQSDWVLGPSHAQLQECLLRDWAQAAIEMAPAQRRRCELWLSTRLRYLDREQSSMRVGHQDLIGWPSAPARPGRGI